MQDLDTAIAYYVGRLIYQYQQPNAQRQMAIMAKQILIDGLPWMLQDAFDINTAVGKQLDILGKYVGIPRKIGDPAPLPFFGFVLYAGGGNMNGVIKYAGGVNSDVVFYRAGYNQAAATALSDTSYLFMMLFKIALNSCDQTLASIQKMLWDLTAGAVHVVDHADMTLTYQIGPGIPVSAATLTPYLPKPMGVGITIQTLLPLSAGGSDVVVTDSGDTVVVGNL